MMYDPNTPTAGFYKTRLSKGGPFCAVRIWRPCCCTINGTDDNLVHEWSETCDRHGPLSVLLNDEEVSLDRVWPHCARWPISEEYYHHMLAVRAWALGVPGAPEAKPYQPIDPMRAAPLF